jgi:hypothetical protein
MDAPCRVGLLRLRSPPSGRPVLPSLPFCVVDGGRAGGSRDGWTGGGRRDGLEGKERRTDVKRDGASCHHPLLYV